jgi:hypothetical protein
MNRSLRRVFVAPLLPLLLAGCDNAAVRQRTEDIQRYNDAMDRKFSTRAAQLVRRRWVVEGDSWYGKMPDGGVVRIDAPVVQAEALHVGKPFYTGWAGDVSVSAVKWETRPTTNHRAVFHVKYRVTFKELKEGKIEVIDGPKVEQATATEVVRFKGE